MNRIESQATSAVIPNEQHARWVIAGLTLVVIVGVSFVLFGLGDRPSAEGRSILPEINASLNGLSGLFLIVGYVLIRQRKITAHKSCMLTAFVLS
ncbi:MAG: DUF420 domain-containing protein, partial [SAR324 cluster bacterium]|nr:DUF420 domain-containing protein [SAR324 cluster bacterium]